MADTKRSFDTRIPLLIAFPVVLIVAILVWGYGNYKREAAEEGSFPLDPAVRTVEIVSDVGNVDVIVGSAGSVRFTAKTLIAAGSADLRDEAARAPFTLAPQPTEDPTVFRLAVSPLPEGFAPLPRVEGDERPGLFRQINSRIEVPVDVAVVVRARQGSIRVDTRQADTSVFTTSGTVMVLYTSKAVTIHNGDGPSFLVGHRGGPVQLRVKGKTRVTMAEVLADVDVENRQGEVIVVLPAHVSCELDARSTTGQVRNAFGLPKTKRDAGTEVVGRIGEGGPAVRVVGHAGTVTVDSAVAR